MKIFKFFKRLIYNKKKTQAIENLNRKLEEHPILKHQVAEIEGVLTNYASARISNSAKNIGLTINAVEGYGKTHFIVNFLVDYLLLTGIIENRKVYKLNRYQFVLSDPNFGRLLRIDKNFEELVEILENIEPGSIIMLDNFHSKEPVLAPIIETVKLMMNNPIHNSTCFILSGGFQKIKYIRADFEFKSTFPIDFELRFSPPSLNQLTKLFINYANTRNLNVDERAIPTLKYFFKKKLSLSKMSQDLIKKGKLDKKNSHFFLYAREFKGLFLSITESKLDEDFLMDTNDIRTAPLFIETEKLHKTLKAKYKE